MSIPRARKSEIPTAATSATSTATNRQPSRSRLIRACLSNRTGPTGSQPQNGIPQSHRPQTTHASSAHLLETAQRLASQLDAKAERLDQLIQQAQQQIDELSALTQAPAAADDASSAEHEVTGARTGRPVLPAPLDPLTRSVYGLADTGRSSLEIAQELEEQIGKVELILALRTT